MDLRRIGAADPEQLRQGLAGPAGQGVMGGWLFGFGQDFAGLFIEEDRIGVGAAGVDPYDVFIHELCLTS